MPKGRTSVPPTDNDGIWFKHRGLPETGPLLRENATSTGLMLNERYVNEHYDIKPPQPFTEKDAGNFKNSNLFSAHDNRHSFHDHGVYFGNGSDTRHLGKSIVSANYRHHTTDKDYLKHFGRMVVNYSYKTEYYNSYHSQPETEKPTRRRFPKVHKEGDPNAKKLDTSTTDWFIPPDVPHRTPTQVLATSQEPFLPKNSWKYSYHGRSECYPSYNVSPKNKPSWLPTNVHKNTMEVKNAA